MSTNTTCEVDTDCPASQVCYSNVSWAGNTQCDCNFFFGFRNWPDCDEFGAQTWSSMVVNSIMILVTLTSSIAGVYMLIQVIRYRKSEAKLWNASNTTAIFATLGSVSGLSWRIVALLSLFIFDADLVTDSVPGKKFHRLTTVNRVFAVPSILFGTLACLNIGLMWIEVANSSKRIRRLTSNRFSWYRKTILLFEGLFAVVIVALMAAQRPDLATIAATPFFLFVLISFALGRRRMKKVLASVSTLADDTSGENKSQRDDRYRRTIDSINQTSMLMAVTILVGIVSGTVYAILNLMNWKEFVRPNSVGLLVTMNELSIFCMLFAIAIVQRYCFQNLKTLLTRVKAESSAVGAFSSGDDGNYSSTKGQPSLALHTTTYDDTL